MKKIAVFTSTRADYGLFYPLLDRLKAHSKFELQLIVSGMHLSPQFGETWRNIEEDGFDIDAKVEMVLSSDSNCGVAKSMGIGTIGFADVLDRLRPDCLFVLGDRFETISIALVAVVMNIPIAHLHGGEITEGAYDDSFRHAITKLSHYHFVASEKYRQRVIQMGEIPDRVWNVGALGLENIRNIPRVSIEYINQKFGLSLKRPFFLVTYHPVTTGAENSEQTFINLLESLERFPEYQILFTYPNSDNGGLRLIQHIESYVRDHEGVAFSVPSLGLQCYLSAVDLCETVIGNSSSGIIEVPSLETTAINIGVRQKGRLTSESVIHTGVTCDEIFDGIKRALTPEAKLLSQTCPNPYGDGDTSANIIRILENFNVPGPKTFYDISFD